MGGHNPSRGGAWWNRRRQTLFDAAGAALVIAVTAANAAASAAPPAPQRVEQLGAASETQPWMASQEVLYEVEGTARTAFVTMVTPEGAEQDFISLPLRDGSGEVGIRLGFSSGATVSVTAQNRVYGGAGTVTCRITVDGTIISEHTSGGLYATVACTGIV